MALKAPKTALIDKILLGDSPDKSNEGSTSRSPHNNKKRVDVQDKVDSEHSYSQSDSSEEENPFSNNIGKKSPVRANNFFKQ